MQFRGILPVLKVTDFETSLGFYQDVLGFSMAWRSFEEGVHSAGLKLGETAVMLTNGEHVGPGKPCFTGTLYFEMTGVREFWERVNGKAPVVWPPSEMEYGTLEFGIHDVDGYTLAFSEQRAS